MKTIYFIIIVFLLGGCAVHYQNAKGVRLDADEVKTQYGSLDDANGYFWSTLDVWIPWRTNCVRPE